MYPVETLHATSLPIRLHNIRRQFKMKKENTYFFREKVPANELDVLLGDAWRHFGDYFFRNMTSVQENNEVWDIVPLRINLEKFSYKKSQKKVLKQNNDITKIIADANITEEKLAIFQKHRLRFTNNIPNSIYDFLSYTPAIAPTNTQEIQLYENGKLYAVSFIDNGLESISSVFAMFDTDFSKRSPGIHTLLLEIEYAIETNKKYVYLGYAHRESSFYDYKKNFNGLEYYDWQGNWKDFIQ